MKVIRGNIDTVAKEFEDFEFFAFQPENEQEEKYMEIKMKEIMMFFPQLYE